MSNVIQLLTDAVANQIAAGEVIQRPASVVKELMENALDAGATEVKVVVKDAGCALVQVIDNGCGMSETDARMAFERHATSKIREANDLFALRTMGFRGEALASIAAVAQVEVQSRRIDDELGIRIHIAASKVEKQELVQCSPGTQFLVKNLFFNVPARRRFLKSNNVEIRHVTNEFQRVVLANPHIVFSLTHNDSLVFALPAGSFKQRIATLMGKKLGSLLIPIHTETSVVNISGFIGTTETAKKSNGDQFFFVNNRFMKHSYLHKAVMSAYQNLIPEGVVPSYFIYFEVDPNIIDVNIHPTKTEIKFEDEKVVWQILSAAVRESLGKHNVVPSIDFDTADFIDIPVFTGNTDFVAPQIHVDAGYNPFHEEHQRTSGTSFSLTGHSSKSSSVSGWEELYRGFESGGDAFVHGDAHEEGILLPSRLTVMSQSEAEPTLLESGDQAKSFNTIRFFQLKSKYILTSVKSGLMVIDQKRAHERILYEEYMKIIGSHQFASQKLLYPEDIHFSSDDASIIEDILDELNQIGLVMEKVEAGHYQIVSVPSQLERVAVPSLIDGLLYDFKHGVIEAQGSVTRRVVLSMAAQSAMPYGRSLSNDEMSNLFDRLFACDSPNYSPGGMPIIAMIDSDDIESRFK